jgi:hypothetical protein
MGFNHQEKEGGSTMDIKTLGIDLAKSVFHLCGMDEQGNVVLRKRLSRGKLLVFGKLTALPRRHGGLWRFRSRNRDWRWR